MNNKEFNKELNKEFDERITVQVPKEFKNKVKKYCIDKNTNMTELILKLLVNEVIK